MTHSLAYQLTSTMQRDPRDAASSHPIDHHAELNAGRV